MKYVNPFISVLSGQVLPKSISYSLKPLYATCGFILVKVVGVVAWGLGHSKNFKIFRSLSSCYLNLLPCMIFSKQSLFI